MTELDEIRAILDPENQYPLIPLRVLALETKERADGYSRGASRLKRTGLSWYEQRKRAGLCTQCPREAVTGSTKCKPCLEKGRSK